MAVGAIQSAVNPKFGQFHSVRVRLKAGIKTGPAAPEDRYLFVSINNDRRAGNPFSGAVLLCSEFDYVAPVNFFSHSE